MVVHVQALERELRRVRNYFNEKHFEAYGVKPEPEHPRSAKMLLDRGMGSVAVVCRKIDQVVRDARKRGFGVSLATVYSRWDLAC